MCFAALEKHWLSDRISGIVPDMEKKIIKKLQQAVGKANLLTSLEECSCYSYDASGQNFMPDAVALPESTAQVAALLRLADEYRFPVIPRGRAAAPPAVLFLCMAVWSSGSVGCTGFWRLILRI